MRRYIALFSAVLLGAMVVVTGPPSAAWAETDPPWVTCSQHTVSVTVSPTDPTPYNVVGRLCLGTDSLRGLKTVELFVSGLTYDHTYFNLSYQPNGYSYVYSGTSRGYSTFNIDRLGVGLSDHPPAAKLTLQAHAYVTGQIVQKLHTGAIGGRTFTNVVGIGHSFGAAVLQYLAGTSTTPATIPNYLVLGSFLMTTYAPGLTVLGNALYPAPSDPAFASAGLSTDYLTTMPNTRGAAFFYAPGALAPLIALDEATKQTGTLAERTTLGLARNTAITQAIQVPVLITVGQYDNLYCNEATGLTCATSAAVKTREAPNFGPKACLKTFVVANTGHSVGLHIQALDSYNMAHIWLDNYTVNQVNQKDANGCLP